MADAEEHESEMGVTYSPEEYAAHMEERKTLIDMRGKVQKPSTKLYSPSDRQSLAHQLHSSKMSHRILKHSLLGG